MIERARYVVGNKSIPILITFVVALSIFLPQQVNAQEKQLIIDVVSEVYEREKFSVSVYDPNLENASPYLINVLIEFNGKQYNISENDENREIIITAPQISKDAVFTITASKSGYKATTTNISVIKLETQSKSQLFITPDDYTVDENKQFSVLVTNETGVVISKATVGIQSCTGGGSIDETDDNGRACLIAPEDYSEIILIAQKEGYISGIERIWINANPNQIEKILQNSYTPIAIASIVLAFVIVFVNFRQKRTIEYKEKTRELPKQILKRNNRREKNASFTSRKKIGRKTNRDISKEKDSVEPRQVSKVEEIRISRSSKNKEVTSVSSENKRKKESERAREKASHEWFEGTDNIRYELDKMTGEIDEEGKDKWFEGTDDIRAKIDKKLKKKDKKKES